jgi:hypothetical protein
MLLPSALLLLLLLCMELAVAPPQNFTLVKHWNAAQVPPDRRTPTPAGPVTNISSLTGCQEHCAATPGCVQFAWNYGGAAKKPPRWYCALSSAPTWSGYWSDHITSGCLKTVAGCGQYSPPPAPVPDKHTPSWTATVPNASANQTFGYPLLAPDTVVHSYVCESAVAARRAGD